MFSEIKHPHFKLHPQGHGGFAETLAGLFRGGGWRGGATVGQEACSVSVACGPVWVCFHTVEESAAVARMGLRPQNVGGSAGQERRGGR